MSKPLWATVPYKGTFNSKSRLSAEFTAEERANLVHAMLEDVLTRLTSSQLFDNVLLISKASDAPEIASRFGISVYKEEANNLPDALSEASEWMCTKHKVSTVFIVPGDVPLISASDLAHAIAKHKNVTVIPDKHSIGTNGLICSLPNQFEYVFDGKSFLPHINAATKRGLHPVPLKLPSFFLDIDTKDDIRALINSSEPSRAKSYLESIDADARLSKSLVGENPATEQST